MASVFGQNCVSVLKKHTLCLRVSRPAFKNLQEFSTLYSQAKFLLTSACLAPERLPLSSNVRLLLSSGRLYDACASSPVGAKHVHTSQALLADKVKINFKTEKETVTLSGAVGDSLLDIVKDNSYEIDGFGACDGTVACSTCHCVLDQTTYDVLNKGVTEEEQDLLDMASGRQATTGLSLAGCGFLAPYVLGAVTCLRETDYWLPAIPSSRDAGVSVSKPKISAKEKKDFVSPDIFMKDDVSASEKDFLRAVRQQSKTARCSDKRVFPSTSEMETAGTPRVSTNYSETQYALQPFKLEHDPPPAGGVGGGGCPTMAAGASAGALLGAAFLAGSPSLEDLWYTFLWAARDSAHYTLGPFSRKFVMERYIREAMEALPPDAHELLSGKFFVSVTDVKTRKNLLVSQWHSREDLIECLQCSCYIPFFSGGSLPLFRGRPCIDGGFSNNQPKPFTSCLCISPFAGLAHISPRQTTSRSMYIHVSNADLLLSKENLVRFYRAIVPYKTKDLYELYWQGFRDAEEFMLNGKISPIK